MPFRPETVAFDAKEKELLKAVGGSKKAVTDAVSKALGDSAKSFRKMSGSGYINLEELDEAIAEAKQYKRTIDGLPETEDLLEIRVQVDDACTLLQNAREMLASS
jgi:hypothetical protein